MNKILIIQTAFIGDVVLATVLIEKLKDLYPNSKIDFLLRMGNEGLLTDHPKLNNVIIWNKRKRKYTELLKTILKVRKNKYDLLVNAHRFSSSGLITLFSSAKLKVGFDKNPISFSYDEVIQHEIGNGMHEIKRDLSLIESLGGKDDYRPVMYFFEDDERRVSDLVSGDYVVMAPASVWFTKQLPASKWGEIINSISADHSICLIGAGNDINFCEEIIRNSNREGILNLAGKLNFLESAALLSKSKMNYVNDSAPMHISSAVNAPTTAIFCSTVPEFGFGPLSDESHILQIGRSLDCRPCGLHGWKKCPEGHFKCAHDIEITSQQI